MTSGIEIDTQPCSAGEFREAYCLFHRTLCPVKYFVDHTYVFDLLEFRVVG